MSAQSLPPRMRNKLALVKRLGKSGSDMGALNEGVFIVKSRDSGRLYIEKRIIPRDIEDGHGWREKEAMKACSHPNIVRYMGSEFDLASAGYGSIIMESCELGALDTVISNYAKRQARIPEHFLWKVFLDISYALCYLQTGVDAKSAAEHGRTVSKKHGWNAITHRDLKPGNVFLTWARPGSVYPKAVLGDFGCSVMESDIARGRHTGQVSRMALAFKPPEAPAYSPIGDVYMLGLLVHCMARTSAVPRKHCLPHRPIGSAYSDGLHKVVKYCLREKPRDRITARELPARVHRGGEDALHRLRRHGVERLHEWAFS